MISYNKYQLGTIKLISDFKVFKNISLATWEEEKGP